MTSLNFTQKISVAAGLLVSSLPVGFRDNEASATPPIAAAAVAPVEPGLLQHSIVQHIPDAISEQANFSQLSEEQVQLLCTLYNSATAEQQESLVKMLARECGEDRKSILLHTDRDGTTLLENVRELLTQEFHAKLGEHADSIKTSTLAEIASPRELNQGGYGTCGTSVLCFMYQERPAEICRILKALCSEDARTTTVTGAEIFTPRFAFKADTRHGRSHSERIIMAACMELANGTTHSYCNECDSNYHNETGTMYAGVSDADARRLLHGLTGEDVTVRSKRTHSADSIIENVKRDLAAGKKVFFSLRWRHGTHSSKSHLRHVAPDAELGDGQRHTHAVSNASGSRTGWSYHQVMALEVKNEQVWAQTMQGHYIQIDEPWLHYRNLHRLTQYEPGSELQNPRRRIIDRDGTEAMPLYQLRDRIERTYTFDPD